MILLPILLLIASASWLAWFFVKSDRGEREPAGALWAVLSFGLLGAVAASLLESWFIPSRYVSIEHPAPMSVGLLLAAMGIGLIEELSKFLPAAWFVYRKRYFNEHTDGIIYFALAGLGFGLPENILYTLQFGAGTGFIRAVLTPFFHAATTGLVGYYLVQVKLDQKPKMLAVWALVGAALLHGLYDFGLLSRKPLLMVLSLVITFGVTGSLFVLYRHATRSDQRVGLSVVGNNSFCRSCGFPNPKRKLYCQRCGKHA